MASGGSPNSGSTSNTDTAVTPTEVALALRTASRCEASTPAARHSRPGRSGATTVTSEPHTIAAGPPSAASASWSSRSGAGCGIGSPSSTASTRRTRSATRVAFQSFQAAGPVASPSAMARACSSSSRARLPTAVATCFNSISFRREKVVRLRIARSSSASFFRRSFSSVWIARVRSSMSMPWRLKTRTSTMVP